ncbi:hypothetical protein DL93DRAFT_1412864 [Clavulina sp. PMI_390]|nr:hypothetical protein DL93DRAFT_1412864 [Clavulina sp. PMI_390]
MDNIVNAAHNVTTLTVYLRVNETENSSPPFRHFALGVLHDLIYHSRPHVTSLGLWFLQTHGMVLHAPDLEALYSNHPRLERLIVEIPVSDDVTAQGCDALRNSHLKCLEVSDVTHLYLARGCCLTQLSIVLKLPAPTTEMFFASIESSLQSLVDLDIQWQVETVIEAKQRFNEVAHRVFFAKIPRLEVLSYRYQILEGPPTKYLDLDMEREGVICAALHEIGRFGLKPHLHTLRFSMVYVDDIERFSQAIFEDGPSSLYCLEIYSMPAPEAQHIPRELEPWVRHVIKRSVGEGEYHILHHTGPIDVARQQAIVHQ